LLHSIFNTVSKFSTQQEIADALKALKEAKQQILDLEVKIDQLIPPHIEKACTKI
jgi:cell division protein FtsL